MSVSGTLNADQLAVGTLSVNWWSKGGVRIEVKAALINTRDGSTLAYTDGTGVVWSRDTAQALEALRQCLEADIAGAVFVGGAVPAGESSAGIAGPPGLGEHLSSAGEPPSI